MSRATFLQSSLLEVIRIKRIFNIFQAIVAAVDKFNRVKLLPAWYSRQFPAEYCTLVEFSNLVIDGESGNFLCH